MRIGVKAMEMMMDSDKLVKDRSLSLQRKEVLASWPGMAHSGLADCLVCLTVQLYGVYGVLDGALLEIVV